MIVLDASVLIAQLDAGDALHDRASVALEEAAAWPFGASTITIAEILVGPARSGQLPAAQAALHDLGLTEIALSDDAASRLSVLRAQTGLKLPDCCVLLAAQDTSAQAVLTFDDRLAATLDEAGIARSAS
ncbi:MAG: type II toxin-antitoxin system VapC family toxin [Solirubrobacteraceae bacterium]